MIKTMNHAEYQKSLKGKTYYELAYIIKDAAAAARACPEGVNAGYYIDEVHYAVKELKNRAHEAIAAGVDKDRFEAVLEDLEAATAEIKLLREKNDVALLSTMVLNHQPKNN